MFLGSSSIRLWKTLADDMAPWPVVGRGYGGARLSDLVVFAERLLQSHDYRALVVFVANDIAGSTNDRFPDKSPEEVLELFELLVRIARQHQPERPIFFIAITPSGSRFQVWDQINRANELIRQYIDTDDQLYFIDTRQHFLTAEGLPNDELFVADRLHLNDAGYRLWSQLIKAELERSLGWPSSPPEQAPVPTADGVVRCSASRSSASCASPRGSGQRVRPLCGSVRGFSLPGCRESCRVCSRRTLDGARFGSGGPRQSIRRPRAVVIR